MPYDTPLKLDTIDQNLRALTENMPAGAYTMVLEPGEKFARFDYVSGAFTDMCGLTREEALTDPAAALLRCIHPDDLGEWMRLNQEAFAKGIKFSGETRLVVDGKVRWVRAQSIPRKREDGAIVWEGVVVDINELKTAQQNLQTVIECTHGGLWVLDLDAGYSDINEYWAQIHGYQREDIYPLSNAFWESLVHPEDLDGVRAADAEVVLGKTRVGKHIYRVRHKDGHYLWVKAHYAVSGYKPDGSPATLSGVVFDITAEKTLEDKLWKYAYEDSLTGLPNRMLIFDRIETALKRAAREHGTLAVMFMDLDGFKALNDAHGHHAGDAVLKEVASRLQASLRASDSVGRVGGDEFLALLPDIGPHSAAIEAAKRVADCLREPILFRTEKLSVRCSIGVASFPSHGQDLDTLIRSADISMYHQKRQQRSGQPLETPLDQT